MLLFSSYYLLISYGLVNNQVIVSGIIFIKDKVAIFVLECNIFES